MYAAAILLGIFASMHPWSEQYMDYWLQNSVASQFWYVLFNELIAVALLWGFIRLRRYTQVRQTLGLLRPQLKDVGYMLAGAVAYLILFLTVASLASSFTSINLEQEQDVGFQAVVGAKELLMAFVSLALLPPLVEELLFRGFLFGGLRRTLRFGITALITSVLFALPHLLGGRVGEGLLWVAGLDTFILSLVLCYLREKTGRLWAGVGLHALKNGLAFWVLFIHH